MYPHIFVENITTGSTTVRCDCAKSCTPKGLAIESKTFDGKKLNYFDLENIPPTWNHRYDSMTIGQWPQQQQQQQQVDRSYPLYPICASPRSFPFLDHPTQASPPPPYTPRQRRLTTDNIDHYHHSLPTSPNRSEFNQPISGLELLMEAIDSLDFTSIQSADDDGAVFDPMETWNGESTTSQDEFREQNVTRHVENDDELFANLMMLAEEAVKRINSSAPN